MRRALFAAFVGYVVALSGCGSIGNQHFYGLQRQEFAPIDRFEDASSLSGCPGLFGSNIGSRAP